MKGIEIWASFKAHFNRLRTNRVGQLLHFHGLRNGQYAMLLGGIYEILTNRTILTVVAFAELCGMILYAFGLMGVNFAMGALLLSLLLAPVAYYTIKEAKRRTDMERLPFWERWETTDEQMIDAIEVIKKLREKP